MRIKLIIAAVLAVLVAAAGATLAFANGEGSSGDDNGEAKTFTVFTKIDQQNFVDLAPTDKPSLGDMIVFSTTVSETRGGDSIGSSGVVCTIVHVSDDLKTTTSQCVATLSLSGGQITAQGLVTTTEGQTSPPFDVAVTGGFGEFEGAGGHVTVEDLSETEERLTFHLLLED
jgi:hypothetical protein